MKKHDVQELVFNSKGGQYESYLCITHQRNEGGPIKQSNSAKLLGAKLLQCLKIKKDRFKKTQSRIQAQIDKLQRLKPQMIDSFIHAFYSNETLYIVSKNLSQGKDDLY